jgi:malonyl CoA-acyl carrier protein transacylase
VIIKDTFEKHQKGRAPKMTTFVFPGQGSQRKGMGGTIFDEFSDLTAQADEILGYSIKELCMKDPDLNLGFTQYTQPALFIVNALSYLKQSKESAPKPDFLAGHSLGEYNALFAAGAFDFATGVSLVQKRGALMSRATGGGMAAIIGLDEKQVKEILNNNQLNSIDFANYNTPYQIVISGSKEDIVKAKPIFEAVKAVNMFIPLNVSGAFHSRYMSGAKEKFAKFLNTFTFNSLSVPVISNVYARPYQEGQVQATLAKQLTSPVKWTETIRYLMGKGEMEFEEIGPGKVLTGLIGRIKKDAEPLIVKDEEEFIAGVV